MAQALELLESALSLLDEAEAHGDIGVHVDLARERLCRTLLSMRESGPVGEVLFPNPAAREGLASAGEGAGG